MSYVVKIKSRFRHIRTYLKSQIKKNKNKYILTISGFLLIPCIHGLEWLTHVSTEDTLTKHSFSSNFLSELKSTHKFS